MKEAARTVAEQVKHVEMTEFDAKDIFRASKLSLLATAMWKKTVHRSSAMRLSLWSLYRDIADGYYRLCAV
jgi:hypothetical protein